MMNQEEIRKQFEAWKNTQGYMGSVDRDERAEIAWDAWQAALASKQEQENKQKILIDAITEVLRVLETDNETIVDVLWTTRNDNETLWEHCASALEQVTGIEYKPQEQFALDLKQEHIESTQDNEGWITFNDGGRPVSHHCFVDVILSDGSVKYKTMAGVFGWRWVDGCVNIIEYRIAKESQ